LEVQSGRAVWVHGDSTATSRARPAPDQALRGVFRSYQEEVKRRRRTCDFGGQADGLRGSGGDADHWRQTGPPRSKPRTLAAGVPAAPYCKSRTDYGGRRRAGGRWSPARVRLSCREPCTHYPAGPMTVKHMSL
jgi:hypothetical protein